MNGKTSSATYASYCACIQLRGRGSQRRSEYSLRHANPLSDENPSACSTVSPASGAAKAHDRTPVDMILRNAILAQAQSAVNQPEIMWPWFIVGCVLLLIAV